MSKLLDEQSIVDLVYRLRSGSVTLFLQFQVNLWVFSLIVIEHVTWLDMIRMFTS